MREVADVSFLPLFSRFLTTQRLVDMAKEVIRLLGRRLCLIAGVLGDWGGNTGFDRAAVADAGVAAGVCY